MARFYFNTHDGESFFEDEDGLELADPDEAKTEAAKALADMAKDILAKDGSRKMVVEVLDEGRNILFRSSLQFDFGD